MAEKGKRKVVVYLTPPQARWLERQVHKTGLKKTDILRRLIDQSREHDDNNDDDPVT